MGKQIGGMIEQYGLNKEKRAELTGEIEAMLPQYMQELTMSGNEESDKQNMQRIERFRKGDSNMADLKGLAGELAMRDKVQSKKLLSDLSAAQLESAKILNQQKKELAANTKNAFDALDSTRLEIQNLVNDGTVELENLSPAARRLLDNPSLLASRDPQSLKFFASDPMEETKSELERSNLQSQIDYRKNMGLAQIVKSLQQSNPTFAEQFTPLAGLQDKLRGLNVKTPKGESVTFAEYEKLHNEEPKLYPMEGEPGAIKTQLDQVNLQIYNLTREQPVQVDLPDEPQASTTTSRPPNLMSLDYDYSNLDPSVAELMAGPGALIPQQITDPAIINMLRQGGTFRGKNLEQLIAEGAIKGQ